MSRDASSVIERNRQRSLFAAKVQQETALTNGIKNVINIEGPLIQPVNYSITYNLLREGATVTTEEEYNSYIAAVPKKIPGKPLSVSAVGGNAQATVSFTAPTDLLVSPILSYTVVSTPGNIRVTGTSSPITVTGLTNGLTYTFRVFATTSFGNSELSDPSNAITLGSVPGPPTSVTATTVTYNSITLTFVAGSNGGSPITNYKYSTDDGVSYTAFNPPVITSPVTITGLSPSTTYRVILVAVNALGDGAESTGFDVTTDGPPAAPGAPTLTLALADDSAVYIYFNVGTGSVENYEYSTDNGATFTELSVADSISPIRIPSLINGTTYSVKLKAKNIS
jgi:hypothetical protein